MNPIDRPATRAVSNGHMVQPLSRARQVASGLHLLLIGFIGSLILDCGASRCIGVADARQLPSPQFLMLVRKFVGQCYRSS